MKNIIHKLVRKFYASSNLLLSSALLLGVFQLPLVTTQQLNKPVSKSDALQTLSVENTDDKISIQDEFFGSEVKGSVANSIIETKMKYVETRKAYLPSLAVIKKHEKTIKSIAKEKGVPEDVAIGVSLLENGGSETAVSSAGALGVFQLMPGTARSLGLTVTKSRDDRKNPQRNIEAGIIYLKANYDRFGDWGLATWAYHAGEGNVAKALKIYAKANHGINLPGVNESGKLKDYVEKYGINIHKLLSSSAVKAFTKKLNDDSQGYPYKVLATATLFKQSKNQTTTVPGLILGNKDTNIR